MAGKSRLGRYWSQRTRKKSAADMRKHAHDESQYEARMALIGLALIALYFVFIFAMVLASQSAHAQEKQIAQVPAAAKQHRNALTREAKRVWGMQAPVPLFAAQIHQESRWRSNATSPVGAVGLAQFMPKTAEWMEFIEPSLTQYIGKSNNPRWAMRALVTYDRWLYDRIKAANECERIAFALSAYNGGLGWVYKRQYLSSQPSVCLHATCAINPGIHPANQRENQHYPLVIIKQHQPIYASWGREVCP